MAFCKRCGNKLKDGEKFCSKCGLEIKKLQSVNEDKNIVSTEKLDKNINNLEVPNKNNIKDLQIDNQNEKIKKAENSKQYEDIEALNDIKVVENKKTKNNNIQSNPNINNNLVKDEKKKSKKGLIAGIIAVIIIASGGFVYKFYDDICYSKYTKEIKKTSNVKEKIQYYDKIIGLERYDKVKDDILELVGSDRVNFSQIDNIDNLSKSQKDELKREVLENFAKDEYKKGNYKQAKELLVQASAYGYNLYESVLCKNIERTVGLSEDNIEDVISENSNINTSFNDGYEYLISDSDVRYLNKDELSIYNKEELALIRNEIYARHGYIFNQEPFKSYFNQKEWYIPNSYFKGSDSELNSFEKENVKLIQKLEKE